MKIVIAMDSYKGCLTAPEACKAVHEGIKATGMNADVIELPLSDGGDGMLEAIKALTQCTTETIQVSGPLPNSLVNAKIGFLHNKSTAIIETAQACGLPLIPKELRNPLKATTHGVGEMIKYCIYRKCRNIILGLGGSATNDLGLGMLHAMGMKFLDCNKEEIIPTPENISHIHSIDNIECAKQLLKDTKITMACDVTSPLYGPSGAAQLFSPQKGATPVMVKILEKNAIDFSCLVHKCIGIDYSSLPGAGAAGGLGYALLTFTNAKFQSGASLMMKLAQFNEIISNADIVITGEGKSDSQTLMGKIPGTILQMTLENKITTLLFSGQIEDKEKLLKAGFNIVTSITPQNTPYNIALQKTIATHNIVKSTTIVLNQIASSLLA